MLVLPGGDGGACGRVRLARGWVRVEGDRITEVVEGEAEPGRAGDALGGESVLVSPGFIDAHVHLPQFDSVGVHGLELLDWLERAVFPAEARWEDSDYAGEMTGRVARRLLSHGTTSVGAYATVHHEAAQAAVRELARLGLHGMVGQVLMDRGAPAELVRPAGQLLEEARRLRGEGRVESAVTPRFAVSCSEDLLTGAGELARARGLAVQTHLAETERECALVEELFGCGYVEVYKRAGLLAGGGGKPAVLGHGIYLDGADLAVLREAGSVIAHCPTANRFLRSGAMDRGRAIDAGVGVALGSDVAGGPDMSMVRVARSMMETAEMVAQSAGDGVRAVIDAEQAWWQITGGNASALGWADVGVIESGRRADLVLIEPGEAGVIGGRSWTEGADPLGGVVWGWEDRWVKRVVIGGRVVECRG